eukprot:65159_1
MSSVFQYLNRVRLKTARCEEWTQCTLVSDYNYTNSCVISFEDDDRCEFGIYKYNLVLNEIKEIDYFVPDVHVDSPVWERAQFVDTQNHILYIFSSFLQQTFYKLNLNTKITTKYSLPSHPLFNFETNWIVTAYIPEVNQIHMTGHHHYVIYNMKDQSFIENDAALIQKWPKLLYIPFTKQLTIVGSNQQPYIYSCYMDEHKCKFDWKLRGTMPHASKKHLQGSPLNYKLILAFKHLVFCFYVSKEYDFYDIWIMDAIQMKWYKSNNDVPSYIYSNNDVDLDGYTYAIKDETNDVYLANFSNGCRVRVTLYDLIPADLCDIYANKYKPLVIGYIRQNENHNNIPATTFCVKLLIWKYFPYFL